VHCVPDAATVFLQEGAAGAPRLRLHPGHHGARQEHPQQHGRAERVAGLRTGTTQVRRQADHRGHQEALLRHQGRHQERGQDHKSHRQEDQRDTLENKKGHHGHT
jgi:hypothetical protein